MTGWDITPSGEHVLVKTKHTAGELGEQLSAYGGPKGDLLKAAHAVGTLQMAGETPPSGPPGPDGKAAPTGLLAGALGQFAEKTQNDLTFCWPGRRSRWTGLPTRRGSTSKATSGWPPMC